MAKYMIHACPSRMWYVEDYLVRSMILQGIPPDDITIWNDEDQQGCLMSCMNAFASCEGDGATWHLQDDVLICHDFADRTAKYTEGVVCGFCHARFEPFSQPQPGEVHPVYAFKSFPCILIPNSYARECAEWFFTDARYRDNYQHWVNSGKHDDGFWEDFIVERHGKEKVLNLTPSLVEHVDWLIGGSVVNKWRGYICRASFFEDEYLVKELETKLGNACH